MTNEEKLLYIETYLDENGENYIMSIKRAGKGGFLIGENRLILTGIGGCYDYIKTFLKQIEENCQPHKGLLHQIETEGKKLEYKKVISIKDIEDAFKHMTRETNRRKAK